MTTRRKNIFDPSSTRRKNVFDPLSLFENNFDWLLEENTFDWLSPLKKRFWSAGSKAVSHASASHDYIGLLDQTLDPRVLILSLRATEEIWFWMKLKTWGDFENKTPTHIDTTHTISNSEQNFQIRIPRESNQTFYIPRKCLYSKESLLNYFVLICKLFQLFAYFIAIIVLMNQKRIIMVL